MLRFAGYAAIFDHMDKGGDIISQGAFTDSLRDFMVNGRSIPLLWQHDPGRQIGVLDMAGEDRRGLRVIAKLSYNEDVQIADYVQSGAVRGLSFGYRVQESSGQNPRHLQKLELVEVSIVTHPMQPRVHVHLVDG
ncbi:HK97 family phage prohead protease [Sphingorhabdus lutea]|nr:HK97 family phage prohead protease [Sphingorhabdus lutea]